MKRLILAAAALLLLPLAAQAAPTVSTVDSIRYGVNPKRVSVKLTTPHTGPCANTEYYTFTGKPLWADAFLEALENGLTVSVTGTGNCTLGVEEIAFFDVLSETSASAKRSKAAH
ncbi:MAG TPA: hypothetical protein VGR74_12095 [Actinomycetota bacterium]|nr:hypothetical protein [Actinomycetota bacterium]